MDQRGLIERARQGEHDAFTSLIDVHLARLDAAARLILRDPGRFEACRHRLPATSDVARARPGR